ncbi:MAG: potassium/proton antiporter [Alphaproteobacteria bacterium]|nr:potassium/proton antiporter [Alphaproteobacteria bacterium]
MEFINLPILLFCLLLGMSVLTSLVSARIGIPLILLFLCIGLVAGEAGFSLLDEVRHPRPAFFIGSVALALILFDSGFHTHTKGYRHIFPPAFWLATIGVVLTAVILAPVAKEVLLVGWLPALLFASIISSTDSAAVFFLLRSQGISIREKVKSTLEVESGANDPMAIFLTLSFITLITQTQKGIEADYLSVLWVFFNQLFVGLGGGLFLGWGMLRVVKRLTLEPALYPILVLAMALGGFAVVNMLGGSGFLAIYLAGLLLGNGKIQAHTQISKFQQTLTWLSQITMFIALGLFVSGETLKTAVGNGLIIGLALIFIARPLAVWIILSFFKNYTTKEKIFISAVGLRGATSILLALAPIVYGLGFADRFFDTIFIMVLLSLSMQGVLIPYLAKWCHLIVPMVERPPEKMQVDLPGLTDSSLIVYELSETTPAVLGEEIPKWARPVLVIRDGISYAISNVRKLKSADKVYVFSYTDARQKMLDTLYGGGQVKTATDVLGDFPITETTTFGDLEKIYGISISPSLQSTVILEFLRSGDDDFEVGDRLSLTGLDIVVRAVENCMPTALGLDIDPDRAHAVHTKISMIQKDAQKNIDK